MLTRKLGLAVLPYISDVARQLDLPVPHPVTAEQVVFCSVLPNRRVEAAVRIKGNWDFGFSRGHVETIQGPRHFFGIEDLGRIPEFFGELRMSEAQAVQLGRETLGKLGIPLESVFAEQNPRVTGPIRNGTNTIPHYRVEWLDPRCVGQAPPCVEMDVNGEAKRVERIALRSRNLERAPPTALVVPPRDPAFPLWPTVNPAYAERLLPIVMRAIDDYGRRLSLMVARPLTTNYVARFSVADNGGWPHCEIELTNGWRFIYRNSMVNGFYAPDNLFSSDNRAILIREFAGEWRMTEAEARELVRQRLTSLNYPTNLVHLDFEPQVHKPAVPGIPRYLFFWHYIQNEDLQSTVCAEVDADRRELESLYYDDKSYWNQPPPIDVPIVLSPPTATNRTTSRTLEKQSKRPHNQPRLELPLPLPR